MSSETDPTTETEQGEDSDDRSPLELLRDQAYEATLPMNADELTLTVRAVLNELASLDNVTEVRLERLETVLGLGDIEDEPEDAEWSPYMDGDKLGEFMVLSRRLAKAALASPVANDSARSIANRVIELAGYLNPNLPE